MVSSITRVRCHLLGWLCAYDDADWERTSMKPYVDMLDRHVIDLMAEKRQMQKAQGL